VDYQETLRYLDSFINYEKILPQDYKGAFRLERSERLLKLLGNPQKDYRIIHIAGTKGKGSVAAMITSVLKEAGLKVGLYTSPHLVSFTERIQFNGRPIAEEELCNIVSGTESYMEELRADGLSFFEAYTACAFSYFSRKGADVAVLETGMGGRLDATNAADAGVSVITPVSMEHTRILGSALRDIAREKAGIIKKGSMVISSPQREEALKEIIEACGHNDAPLRLVGRDILMNEGGFDRDSQTFSVKTEFMNYSSLRLKLRGRHQLVNAATAIGAVEALRAYGHTIPQDTVREGLLNVEWPGRLELLDENPLVVADGAQNPASAAALVEAVKRHFTFRRLILILGISKDKDIEKVSRRLLEITDSVILTRAQNPRAADPEIIKKYIEETPCEVTSSSGYALRSAYSRAGKEDLILVAGSLYLVGEVRHMVGEQKGHEIRSR